MKKFYLIILAIFTTAIAYAQTIDCTMYQNAVNADLAKVNNDTAQLNSDNNQMATDQNNLSSCQNVDQVIATPAYQQAAQTITAQPTGGLNTTAPANTGTNTSTGTGTGS